MLKTLHGDENHFFPILCMAVCAKFHTIWFIEEPWNVAYVYHLQSVLFSDKEVPKNLMPLGIPYEHTVCIVNGCLALMSYVSRKEEEGAWNEYAWPNKWYGLRSDTYIETPILLVRMNQFTKAAGWILISCAAWRGRRYFSQWFE